MRRVYNGSVTKRPIDSNSGTNGRQTDIMNGQASTTNGKTNGQTRNASGKPITEWVSGYYE